MLKRHEVEVLLKSGHSQAEVARLTGVGLRSVQRLAKEVQRFWKSPIYLRWKFFGEFARQATKEARPPCMLWWPRFVRKRQNH